MEFLRENWAQILVFSVHFVTWLSNGAPSTAYMNSCLNSINTNEHDIWIIPSNVNSSHWVITIVILNAKTILHLDSLHKPNHAQLHLVWSFIKAQLKTNLNEEEWSVFAPTDFLRQTNTYDCGVYVCLFAFALCSGTDFAYIPKDSRSIRAWESG